MLTGWLFGVQVSTVGRCLAGQRKLSGFTYTTLIMFCLFSVLSQAQAGVNVEWQARQLHRLKRRPECSCHDR